MGVHERKKREKEQLKKKIITASLEIAKNKDWASLSLRKVANYIEYSTKVIYEYFGSKEALLINIRNFGFELLKNELVKLSEPEIKDDTLLTIGMKIWDFACENPELYQVMYNLGGINIIHSETEEMKYIKEKTSAIIKHIIQNEDDSYYYNYWSLIHGFISFKIGYSLSSNVEKDQMGYYLKISLQRFCDNLLN